MLHNRNEVPSDNRDEVPSDADITASGVMEDKTSTSLSIVSASVFVAAQGKRGKKVNTKFIGSPWTPEGKGRRRRTRKSQIFVRATSGGYSPVLALDPTLAPEDIDADVFDAWFHKQHAAFKE